MRKLSKVVTAEIDSFVYIKLNSFRGRYPKSCATHLLLLNFYDPQPKWRRVGELGDSCSQAQG